MAARKKKSLGDDPLAWLKQEAAAEDKPVLRKKAVAKKTRKKASQKKPKKVARVDKNQSGATILLEPVLVIDEAIQLHKKLNTYINQQDDVIIDGSNVNMIDTAMLQLLTAFIVKLKNKGLKVTWKDPSEELISRATLLDLHKQLELG